jgi:prepilin-type processing-associated H-X9-DG protein
LGHLAASILPTGKGLGKGKPNSTNFRRFGKLSPLCPSPAAILFPVFSQAREKARQISCLSGVRQVGLGLAMYVQDYDELMPRIWYGPSSALQMYFWMDALLPYIKTANFFSACPSKNFGNWTPSNYIPPATYARTNVAFAANALYSQVQDAIDGQSTTPPFRESNVALTQIVIPASTIALGDGSGYYIAYSAHKLQTKVELDPPFSFGWTYPNIGRTTDQARFVGRHFAGANWAFCDGHAKWLAMRHVARTNRNGILFLFTNEDDENW